MAEATSLSAPSKEDCVDSEETEKPLSDQSENQGEMKPNDIMKNSENITNKGPGKKRKREDRVDHYVKAYENIHYTPILPDPQEIRIAGVPNVIHTTTPGTPLRQFKHSFQTNSAENKTSQIIHRHANGLCVVTAGSGLPSLKDVVRIEFVAQVADPCSAGERRKNIAKLLKKGRLFNNNNSDGIVTPTTEIARVHLQSGSFISLCSCVWGTILELNTKVTAQQLVQDPLLEGYLAVILPTGPFPPRPRTNDNNVETMANENETEAAEETVNGVK